LQSIVPPGQAGSSGSTSAAAYTSAVVDRLQQGQQGTSKSAQSQMPSAADISLMLSLGLGLDASQLASLDLQKLAMYLVSI
jgi:hypothetical protein